MKTVRAIEIGYDNVAVRNENEEFEVPDEWNAPWTVDKNSPVRAVPKPQEGKFVVATTLAGIQQENANELV